MERIIAITLGFLLSIECDTRHKALSIAPDAEEGFGNTYDCPYLPRNGPSINPPNHWVSQMFRFADSTLSLSPTPTAQSHLWRNISHCPIPTLCHLQGSHLPHPSLCLLFWPTAIALPQSPCCPHPILSSTGKGDRASGVELRPGHSLTQQPSVAPYCLCSKVHLPLPVF